MTIASPSYLPQPGQLVELRGRRFVVTETRAAAFGGAVLSEAGRNHAIWREARTGARQKFAPERRIH
ncbi:MAG TPA: hypothetical protein PK916_16925 [Bacteroidota bacterium]|nr:hypothetical protein [Bacteroidota bacterium]